MEMEFFISDEDDWKKWHRYWIDWCRDWLLSVGIPASYLSEYDHPKEKLSHYSRGTTDIMFRLPVWRAGTMGHSRARRFRPLAARQSQRYTTCLF
jgi:glycyl-tRNA synthetase (class II)